MLRWSIFRIAVIFRYGKTTLAYFRGQEARLCLSEEAVSIGLNYPNRVGGSLVLPVATIRNLWT